MNNKKIYFATALLSISLMITSSAIAANNSNTNPGGTITIADATGTSAANTLVFESSPGVYIETATLANAFTIHTTNWNANAANRLEYGIWNGYPGYYQMRNDDADFATKPLEQLADDTAGTNLTASPFGGSWSASGGT